MKIFVTGGAGFIGRSLVSKLLESHFVTIYDSLANSSESDVAALVESGAKFVRGDILNYSSLAESCKDHDIMIHLAAESDVSESIQNPDHTMKTNVEGTVNTVKSCVANHIKKIIFASSAAVYGDCKKMPITETSDTVPVSPYGKSKLLAESEIKKTSEESALQYVILRIFNVYGNGQNQNYSGVITKFSQNISNDKPLVIYGDGMQTRDFVLVDDVVNAFQSSIHSDKTGTYNIASGKKTSIKNLADYMIKNSKKHLDIIFKEKKNGDIKDSYADTSLAQKELGFNPRYSINNSKS